MSEYVNRSAQYVTQSSHSRGAVPMWWDTGALIDRRTGAVLQPELLVSLLEGVK